MLTKISHSPGTTDSVNVLLDVARKVKIDDVFDMGYVQASGSYLQFKQTISLL